MNISEQIRALQEKIAATTAEKNAFVLAKGVDGTAEDVEKARAWVADIKALEEKLDVLKEAEKSLAAQAVALPASENAAAAAVTVTDTSNVSVKSNAPHISPYTQYAMCLAAAQGNKALVPGLAEKHYKGNAALQAFVKEMVAGGSTGNPAWAGSLIYPQEYLSDFIDLLYPKTILGRLALRKIPFNVTVAGQTGGTSVSWVGEQAPAPVTSATFNRIYLTHTKIAAISVLSAELIRFSNPAAEALVQADLLKAAARGLDLAFMGSAAATPNVSPAGMLNGVSATKASGTTPLAVITDVQKMLAPYITLNYDVTSAVIVMPPALALQIGQLRNGLGGQFFPGIGMEGGTLIGVPVITSNNAPAGTMTLFVQDEIYLSEDAAPVIDLSKETSIIMDGAPDKAASAPVSMFQTGQVAIRIEQMINWQLRRTTGAASQVTGCAYVSDAPTK